VGREEEIRIGQETVPYDALAQATRILQRVSRDQGWLSRFWKEQHKPGASRAREIPDGVTQIIKSLQRAPRRRRLRCRARQGKEKERRPE